METESPEWRKFWKSDELLVIGDDFLGGSFEEEIYVQVATSSDVAQNCILLVVADDWCLRVGTSEEDSQELV